MLLRVLDLRLRHSLPQEVDPEDLWTEVLPTEVAGLPTRDFILQNALARPRDVIYILKQAIAKAVNKNRHTVSEEDFVDARREYSEFAFRSVLAEDDPTRGHLEAILYEFAGVSASITETQVVALMMRAGVGAPDVEFYLDLLCDVNFLKIPTVDGHRYSTHESERQMLREMAKRIATERGTEQIFLINAAFHQVLQIE